jgi:glycosyltransferase involved in cell wall biosynthesis
MISLSIITINFNNAAGLYKTIESVTNQTFTNYEYIIIDGGSTDGSVEVIKEYSDKITYWVSDSDNGIYDAMNKGIEKIKGDYVLFLNSGDIFSSINVLKNFASIKPKEDLLYGRTFLSIDNKIISETTYPDSLRGMELFEYTINHQSTFYNAQIFKTSKYDLSYSILADWVLMMDLIFKQKISYRRLDFNICIYDLTGFSSRLENSFIMEQERFRYLEENSFFFIPHLIRNYSELHKKYEKLNSYVQNTLSRKISRKIKRVFKLK